jgi:hypothetical protein
MQTCAARYVLTSLTTLKLQLASLTVVGLTTSKFKPLILPMPRFSFSRVRQSQSYFMTVGLPPISFSRRQFLETHDQIFPN